MSAFIEERRCDFGVEPICRALGMSASAYYERRGGRRSARRVEDERLLAEIKRVHAGNYEAYGSRRVWKELLRRGETVARCTVERLMAANGIQGAKRRGRPWRTTTPDPEGKRKPDLVDRDFTASAPESARGGRLRAHEALRDRAEVRPASRSRREQAGGRPDPGDAGEGGQQPRQRRDRPVLPDGQGPASKTRKCT